MTDFPPSNEQQGNAAGQSAGQAGGQSQQPQQVPQQPMESIPQYGQYAPQQGQPQYTQYNGQAAYGQPSYSQPGQGGYAGQPQYEQPQYSQPGGNAPANPFSPGYQGGYQGEQQQPYGQGQQYAQPQYGQPLPQGAPAQAYAFEPPIDKPWYGIGFGAAVKRLFVKMFVWTGRASRGEFWWAFLFVALVSMLVGWFIGPLGLAIVTAWGILSDLALLPIGIRRLHDANLSGWFMLIPVIATAANDVLAVAIVPRLGAEFAAIYAGGDDPALYEEAVRRGMQQFLERNATTLGISTLVWLAAAIAMIVTIVLLAGRSKPEGARFDAPAQR